MARLGLDRGAEVERMGPQTEHRHHEDGAAALAAALLGDEKGDEPDASNGTGA